MMHSILFILALFIPRNSVDSSNNKNDDNTRTIIAEAFTPRHVHLSYKAESTMTVTFSTPNLPDYAYVEYGLSKEILQSFQDGVVDLLVSRSEDAIGSQYIHEITLSEGILPGKTYCESQAFDLLLQSDYRCVTWTESISQHFHSEIYKFRVPLVTTTNWSPFLLVFGDLAHNGTSMPSLVREVDSGVYDAIIHLGDVGYNLNKNGGQVGDLFMTTIEKMAAKLPYQVTPGNHDVDLFLDYNDYSMRFRMPGTTKSLTYSWNLGLVHFISINTEDFFHTTHKWPEQFRWIQQDLQEANKLRNVRPWLIVYGHTPMYCSSNSSDSCQFPNSTLRIGCGASHCPGLERLFYDHGVDLFLWGHEHNYETTFPLYDYKVYNGSLDKPYTNPRAPVHVITGVAGSYGIPSAYNVPYIDHFDDRIPKPYWSRFRDIDYSYSRLKIVNGSHLEFQQVSATTGKVIDDFTLIQEQHGPFNSKLDLRNYM